MTVSSRSTSSAPYKTDELDAKGRKVDVVIGRLAEMRILDRQDTT